MILSNFNIKVEQTKMKYMKWYSQSDQDSLLHHLSDLDRLAEVICKMREGNVYRYDGYVIKERIGIKGGRDYRGPKKSVRREYEVGILANRLRSPHLVKTVGYVEGKKSSKLITKLVDGITLTKFLKTHNKNEYLPVLRHIFIVLFHLQKKIKFCHYGLHVDNIMIEKLPRSKTYEYRLFEKTYIIETRYNPVIIDLARSYVDGIRDMYYEGEVLGSLVTPGLYDGQVDVTYLLWSMKRRMRDICPRSYQLLVDNELLTEGRYSLNHNQLNNVPKSLRQNDSLWACGEGCDKDYKQVLKEYRREYDRCGEIVPANLINKYAKKLGACMVALKNLSIEDRPYNNRDVFLTLIRELD